MTWLHFLWGAVLIPRALGSALDSLLRSLIFTEALESNVVPAELFCTTLAVADTSCLFYCFVIIAFEVSG